MSLTINTNIPALIASDNVVSTLSRLTDSARKLSSGYRINDSSDDPAGLGRADHLRLKSRGIQAALRNTNDGISALEIADKSAEKISELLTRMNELAVSSATGTISASARSAYSTEWDELRGEVERIAQVTEFDGNKLLSTAGGVISLQVGYAGSSADRIGIDLVDIGANVLSLAAGQISTQTGAAAALSLIDSAISTVGSARVTFGTATNRLKAAVDNLGSTRTGFLRAESRIRDVDFAEETVRYTKNNILLSAGISVLAQANIQPRVALGLLEGVVSPATSNGNKD